MKTVRVKFQCNSVTEMTGGYKEAKLSAVNSSTGENSDFAKATPNGQLSISISPEVPANDYFKPGKCYYMDFSEVAE